MYKWRKIRTFVRTVLIKLKYSGFYLTSPSRLIYVETEEGAGKISSGHLPGVQVVPSTCASYVHSLPCPQ
jgi:hypothetical protein